MHGTVSPKQVGDQLLSRVTVEITGPRAYRQKELRVSTAAAAEAAGTGCRAKTLRLSLTPTASLTHRVSAQEMAGPGSPLSELELWTRQGRAPGQSTW